MHPYTRPRTYVEGGSGRSMSPTSSCHTPSIRSSWKGSHPTWLSAYASLIDAKRHNEHENTQSHTGPCACCAFKAIAVASGASSDVVGMDDEEPMCIDTTVSLSLHASHSGSQAPV